MGAQGPSAPMQSLWLCTEGKAWTRSPQAAAAAVRPAQRSRMLGSGTCNRGLVFPGFRGCRQHGGEAGGREGSGQLFP